MQTNTAKTTLTFSPGFLQRLRTQAKERNISMSRIVENGIDPLLAEYEQQRLERMYRAMEKWMGSGSPDITDASQNIDETLYGEDGVWKGQHAE